MLFSFPMCFVNSRSWKSTLTSRISYSFHLFSWWSTNWSSWAATLCQRISCFSKAWNLPTMPNSAIICLLQPLKSRLEIAFSALPILVAGIHVNLCIFDDFCTSVFARDRCGRPFAIGRRIEGCSHGTWWWASTEISRMEIDESKLFAQLLHFFSNGIRAV
jgi:hypothetical protein